MIKLDKKFFMYTVAPRVLKAFIWGTVTYILIYSVPSMLIPQDIPVDIMPFDLNARLFELATISVFFAVVGQLLSKTLIGCGFGIVKAIVYIIFFFTVSDGGIFSIDVPLGGTMLNVTVDVSIILLMVVSVNLLGIAKSLLDAIRIFSEKSVTLI